MAGEPLKEFYWDSCVFISYINGIPERLADIEWFLAESGKEHQLVTSVFTIAEVSFAELEKTGGRLDEDVLKRIDALWIADDSPVKLIDIYPQIVFGARDLARRSIEAGLGTIKGGDAVHLATAIHRRVAEIHSYSRDWPSKASVVGLPIHPPVGRTPRLPGT
jgi:predicted nucleic acid-binding protein